MSRLRVTLANWNCILEYTLQLRQSQAALDPSLKIGSWDEALCGRALRHGRGPVGDSMLRWGCRARLMYS